ncbi:MAG TPA: conjugal transfer protein [Salmonella bongori]|uniref:Conjugal transfer protein n=2 Tax=Salmonella bongori TaxID=54736 RepID=A0A248KEX1_SALBN|nr:conjugal transfer protein TraF [Salmonella bongori]ASG56380.1 conjugal transfer protein [Salmonella bongori serovar 66:z41:- str. SA19983605]ECC9752820.1 conjugal transfer protein [Salmonella bongori]EDP8563015.1 conjugal transfer protein TraF [Salmonella bongori]EDP8607085.1 conjugal transfer protein TraF [Salmonella bongori]EDP8649351.1 conjugal transfer protein TraF [Salmonella bongori]
MNKNLKLSVMTIAASFFMAKQTSAANTWAEARNDAMGGTGVASAHYGSGVLLNPALLAKAKPEDNITVVLPAVGVQITDKDNLQDEINDISDKINYYDHVVDSLTPGQILLHPRGVLNQFQGAARDLADELEYLNGKTARANAGAGVAVSIPGQTLSVAFIAKGYAHGRVSSSIDQNDIQYLRNIQRNESIALREAGRAALLGTDEITKHLNSTASGRVAIVSDYGIAVAKQWVVGDVPVSIGVTPKLQKTWLYNYTTSIYHYDSSDWNSSRYRNDDTGFNIDAGLAADFGENWTLGLSGQNLVSRDIDTKEIYITNGISGETTHYKDTYQIRPLVTAGIAWHNEVLTVSADGDLTETKGFKSEDNSRYVGVGAEVRPLAWLAVRAGYRADVKNNDSNVFTGGLGFAPYNRVHLDLMGLYGEDETWGAGAQLTMTF